MIAYLREVENQVAPQRARNNKEADQKAQEILVLITKLRNTFDEAFKLKELTNFLIVEAEIQAVQEELSIIPDRKDHLLGSAEQIYARFEHIIKQAALWHEPLAGFSADERDLFNRLVFRDLYHNEGPKANIPDPQNMENQEIDDEKSKNIKVLNDKVAKLEQDVLNLSMHQREEVKQDNNCDA